MTHDIPDELKPAPGEELVLQAHASGVQVYACVPGENGKRSWVLKAPEADLLDELGTVVGKHYGGPTWKHCDGSEVVGKPVARVEATDPAAIPWLLVTITARLGDGALSRVTSIQRIRTTGGKAPALPCDQNAEVRVPYTAV
ncbi:MAG TPA: DUF3455 domain-containing protein [Terriglobales bacterium]|nr:DUF3455 domain-containing protein [Terriglobales bacterium]